MSIKLLQPPTPELRNFMTAFELVAITTFDEWPDHRHQQPGGRDLRVVDRSRCRAAHRPHRARAPPLSIVEAAHRLRLPVASDEDTIAKAARSMGEINGALTRAFNLAAALTLLSLLW